MKTDDFRGKYVRGTGDSDYLRLIDESFAMLHTSGELPYLKMLYKSETDMFGEGFLWGNGWWIQNSYGFALGAAPDGLGEKTASVYAECVSLLKTETEPMRRRMLEEILASCTAAAERRRLPFDRHTLRPMTEDRRTQIIDAYDKTAETLYEGYLRIR